MSDIEKTDNNDVKEENEKAIDATVDEINIKEVSMDSVEETKDTNVDEEAAEVKAEKKSKGFNLGEAFNKAKGMASDAVKFANDVVVPAAKQFTDDAVKYANDKAIPAAKKTASDVKKYTEEKVIPVAKETANKTATAVKDTSKKVVDKVRTTITEEQMMEVLNTLYVKSVNGIPKVSLPVDDLVEDYVTKNKDIESAAKSLINNSTVKCGTSGFVTSFGGFASMIATLPANITSVMYVQLRMCCAIAKMGDYDIHSDQVQTMVFACLTGSAMSDVLKQAGVKFGNKFGTAMVSKIPGKTLTAINKKVGFRFVTKFGEKGIVNLGSLVPVLGGFIGGGIDIASTRVIGANAYSVFIKGEVPTKEEIEKEIPITVDSNVVTEDIDDKMLEKAIEEEKEKTSSENIVEASN